MKAKVLVTGNAGFIGHHLVERLAREGFDVYAIDVINDYYDVSLKYARLREQGFAEEVFHYNTHYTSSKGIHFLRIKLEDKASLDRYVMENGIEIIVHLAAQAGVRYSLSNPQAYIDSNIQGFINVLEVARHAQVKHFVFASSSSVYGLSEDVPFRESSDTDHPISLYAATKKSNELMAHAYAHLFRLPCTGLRFFTVYGPWGRPDMALFMFTRNILEGKPVELYNYGDMLRDFTFVDDIIESVYRVVGGTPPVPATSFDPRQPESGESSAPFRVYNIGNNQPVKLADFVEAIEEALEKKAQINLLPLQAGDVPFTYADSGKLYNNLNFKPGTSIKAGIRAFVNWYTTYYRQ